MVKRWPAVLLGVLLAGAVRAGEVDVTVDTDQTVGRCYRFWSVSVFTSQQQFTDEAYIQTLRVEKPYMREVNCVRLLGGRDDGLNNWYRGVDENGRVMTDFSGLVASLRAIVDAGYIPRLVLDNVPTAMSASAGGEMHMFGNCNPPDDYEVWRQYITVLLETLIREFGMQQVASWRFRVGTEPDLFPNHWNGTKEQYLKHYDITVDAVTRMIPEADIGPGNILNPLSRDWKRTDANVVGDGKSWGLDIIDHCAVGTNYVTGQIGTRMRHFSISYYDGVGWPSFLNQSIARVRERLSLYPQFKEIPVEIAEFGVLWDENRRRLWGNDMTEWSASWYAALGDVIYRNGVASAFDWCHASAGLPHARLHVMRMFEMMAGGERLNVQVAGKADGPAGAIACAKEGRIYVMLYNHNPQRESRGSSTFALNIKGRGFENVRTWSMNEWVIDQDHGVWAHAFFHDCEKAKLEPLPGSALYDGSLNRRFGPEWKNIFERNKSKYTTLAEFARIASGVPVSARGGELSLEFEMPVHSVRLIELIPDQPAETAAAGNSPLQESGQQPEAHAEGEGGFYENDREARPDRSPGNVRGLSVMFKPVPFNQKRRAERAGQHSNKSSKDWKNSGSDSGAEQSADERGESRQF